MLAYRPSVLRVVTFRLLKPPPWGVVMGALKNTLVRRSDSQALGFDAGAVAPQINLLADLDGLGVDPRARLAEDMQAWPP